MCGIHGIINAAPKRGTSTVHLTTRLTGARDFIQSGFVAGALRGMDSSGMFQIDKKLQTYLHKLPIMGPIFIEDKVSRAFFSDVAESPFTVCHVRAATSGRVSLNNCHPFIANRDDGTQIIGVHNGTLTGWQAIAGKNASDYSVDSEWAFNHIAAEGADAFEDFSGAYSLVWHDNNHPTRVMFARNDERPMMFARTKDKKSLLFASEAGMLSWLARRHEIDIEDDIYFTDPDRMYCVDFNNEELVWQDLGQLPKRKVTSTAVTTTTYNTTSSHGAGYYSRSKSDMVAEVNGALKRARDARMSQAVIPFGDQEEDTLPNFAAGDEDATTGQFIYVADAEWYETHSAMIEEINHAKSSNWFGELAMVTPALYDESQHEILCDMFDPDQKGVSFQGTMRGFTKSEFDEVEGVSVNVVIIGSGKDPTGATHFVLTPLNDVGQDAMEHLIN